MKKLLVLMVALGLVFSLNSWVQADSDVIENPANGHKYQRIDTALTWHEAKSYCEDRSQYLVTVTSSDENDFVFNHMYTEPNNENIWGWLGATDEANEGEWKWVTGEPWNYTNWASTEPNNYGKGEHYLVHYLGSGEWADYGPPLRPSVTLPFVCEWGGGFIGFVITNTSPCSGVVDCMVTVNDFAVPQNSSTEIKPSDRISMGKKSKTTIDHKCISGLIRYLIFVTPLCDEEGLFFSCREEAFILAILALKEDPELCRNINSQQYAGSSSNHISLELQSGGGRFETVFEDFALDIETDVAKVSSVAKNDFAVGHNPDTGETTAVCYKGSVTVGPTNPNLSSVTLKAGQQVEVWSDGIGPITKIRQTIFAPILLLLYDDAK
jgi:hypothetical protein